MMLFGRRKSPSLFERIRIAAWPRRSWVRSAKYIVHRVWRLSGSPHRIAIGCAAGFFVSCTPFLGFHFLLAGLLAWSLRGSIIASALGTFFGNPITFPIIWISTFKLGNWLLGKSSEIGQIDLAERLSDLRVYFFIDVSFAFEMLFYTLWPVIRPMILGAIPIGLVVSTIGYFIIKKLVEAYQIRRQRKIALVKKRRLRSVHKPAQA